MSGVHIAPPELQPASFEFTPENMALAKTHIAKYPEGRQQSAVMPLLDIAQRQHNNWVPQAAIRYIADLLGMPAIRVLEVASFYTMYNLAPVGTHFVQVCTTTPCWLRGSDKVLSACKKHLGVGPGETTPDGKFTVIEVECLGACVNAPMLQLGDDFYEDLDEESTGKILEALKRGETPKPGPQNGRLSSEPLGGATTLTTFNPAAPSGGSDD
ncbi:MAG: NADH-quinone oxidoreductase subunit NuoE [Ferrovibrio sp.]|uniref:NADH-quinone oxidoreductase subunit NuoE n=1 Tax=Ferrovibrio sp. TaxID=1917215 RepID=UPI00391B7556